eukprot:COSAG06_NODE_9379_length_1916_cov_41.420473_3_plen_188_part_01
MSASATVGIVTSAPAAKGTPRGTVYSDALGSRDVEQTRVRSQGAKSRRRPIKFRRELVACWWLLLPVSGEKFKVTLQLHFAFSLRMIRKSHCCRQVTAAGRPADRVLARCQHMMMGPQRIALLAALAALAADIVADPVADPGHPIHGDEIVDVTFPPGGAKLGLAFYRPLVPPTISLVAPGSLAAATA